MLSQECIIDDEDEDGLTSFKDQHKLLSFPVSALL